MLVLSGWVVFDDGPASRIEASLDGTPLGRARLGLSRPDVGAAREGPDAAVSGFELEAALRRPFAGEHELRVEATSTGGERHEFEPLRFRLVEPAALDPAPRPPRPERVRDGGGRRVVAFSNVLTLGGAAIYLFDVLREARRQGLLEPTFVSAIDGPLRNELEAEGVPVHLLGPVALDDLDAYLDRIDELAAWAADREFDAVLVNTATGLTLPGADLAARLDIPAIWSIHESFDRALLWRGLGPGLREHAEAALARADLAVFQAEATRALYSDSIPEDRSVTIPYGFDLGPIETARAGFDRPTARRAAGVPEGAELVICVGTIEPRKAQVQLAQAFELVAGRRPDAVLAFVGGDGGRHAEVLADRIAASPFRERIRIVPRTREVQPWYGMADLLVCASDVESLPRTVVEAMAWETPVLATAVFGLPELIEDGADGWLCEPGDVSELAAGLERALGADAAVRRRIGTAGRARVLDRHDLGTYARELAARLDRVAS